MVLNISRLLDLNKLSDEKKRNICNDNYLYELEKNKSMEKIELSTNETMNKLIILLRNGIITQIEELNKYLLDPVHFCSLETDNDIFHDAEGESSEDINIREADNKSQNEIYDNYTTEHENYSTTINNSYDTAEKPIGLGNNNLSQSQKKEQIVQPTNQTQQGGKRHKRTQRKSKKNNKTQQKRKTKRNTKK